jgi:TonB-linked SusC/RagA family outer membrane protein
MAKLLLFFGNYKMFPAHFARKTGLTVLLATLLSLSAFAQQIEIKGKVFDEKTNVSVIGATVKLKGKQGGTITDTNGNYSLSVSKLPVTLNISAIGYKNQEIDVYEAEPTTIYLTEDQNRLNEVVVVGYQQTKLNAVTAVLSTVKLDQVANIASPSVVEKLQGAVPGLIIARNSGDPGVSSFVHLRGATSFSSTSPLYIIDGIATTGSSQQISQAQSADPIAEFNPEDIESVTILKDASATAQYGTRGANGVILITTKRGAKNSKTRVNFKSEFGVSQHGKLWDLTTGPQHAQIVNECYKNDGLWATRPFRAVSDGGIGLPEEQNTYDRISLILRNGFQNTNNISISGGDSKTNFYLSGEYTTDQSILKLEDFSRYGFRINLDHSITKNLKVGTSNAISFNHRTNVKVGDGPSGFFQASLHTPTYLPLYKPDGTFNAAGAFNNPEAIIENWDGGSDGFRITNNFYAKFDITKDLYFKSSWSNDRNIGHDTYYYSPLISQGYPNGAAEDAVGFSNRFSHEQTLNYLQTFAKNSISAYLGYGYLTSTNENVSVSGTNFASDAFKRVASTSVQTGSASGSGSGLISYFGGFNYSYDNRYSIDATVRRDVSSQIGINNRAGYFPSVGLGWNPINESFFPKTDIINDLRIKGSYGLTGNISGGNGYLGLWSGGSVYDGNPGLAPSQLGNPDLKWETTRQWSLGLNTSLFKNRLQLELNLYDKYTSGLVLSESLPGKTGFSSVLENAGEISNKGYEFSLSSLNITAKDYSWKTTFTASRNINKIEKLDVEQQNASYGSIARQGYPLYSFYLYDYKGVDPKTGDAVYADVNGDGKLTEADKKIFGNAWPLVEGIFKNTVSYKGLSLDFSFYYKYGYQVFNYTRSFLESGGTRTTTRSIQESSMNYWTIDNKDTYTVNADGYITDVLPRPKTLKNPDGSTNYEQRSTRFLEDGSFIRLQNVTLSYSLPKSITSKLKLQKATLHVTGLNLLLLTKYSGPDPEVNSGSGIVQGLDFGTTPQPRTILFGIDITI